MREDWPEYNESVDEPSFWAACMALGGVTVVLLLYDLFDRFWSLVG